MHPQNLNIEQALRSLIQEEILIASKGKKNNAFVQESSYRRQSSLSSLPKEEHLIGNSSIIVAQDLEKLPLWVLAASEFEEFHRALIEINIFWDTQIVKTVFLGQNNESIKLRWPLADNKFAYLFGCLVENELLNIFKNRKWKELNEFFRNKKGHKFNERSLTIAYAQSKADEKFRIVVDELINQLKKRRLHSLKISID